jgi:hypothetical protein
MDGIPGEPVYVGVVAAIIAFALLLAHNISK